MKPKTKAFADALLADPKKSATTAYLETHETNNRATAKVEASKLLTKPNVQLYLDKHIDKARNRVVELVDSEKEQIALQASESILDRALGKPTQRVEQHSTSVNLSLDLTNITEDHNN